jgi:DNA-binding NtrC family response regulator
MELGVSSPSIHPEAVDFLQSQAWPGNVRELENTVRQALLAARPFAVSPEHVKDVLGKARKPLTRQQQTHAAYVSELLARAQNGDLQDAYSRMIRDMEPELFQQAIQLANGNQAKAARWLGVTRLKMREKLIELGLHPGHGNQNHSN